MVDLQQQYLSLKTEIDATVTDVLHATKFIMGPNVQAFEVEAAKHLGVKHAVSCGNGTDALHLAMLAAGIGPGDEVITTPFTFIATAEAIAYVGATPVFVDIEADSFNLNPDLLEAAITPKTKAIVPVHLFGLACNMTPIEQIAKQHKLTIIEDCAQSFGALTEGRQTGSIGSIGCFSFFPSKNLGCFGDGGMLSTNDEQIAQSLGILRNHGSAVRYHHSVIGYNSRLDELQAAILRVKLKHIAGYNTERLRVASLYNNLLSDLPIQLPLLHSSVNAADASVFHQYTFLTERREDISKALTENSIASAIYYPIPLHQQEAIKAQMTSTPHCPVAEKISANCLSLPIYPELENEKIERICGIVKGVLLG